MKKCGGVYVVFIACLILLASCSEQRGNKSSSEAELRKQIQNYQDTFNRHDAKALAEYWADDATYINPLSGAVLEGRKAIEERLEGVFDENKDLKLQLKTKTIQFPSADQAIEKGEAELSSPNQSPLVIAYKAVYEKEGDKWLLISLSEAEKEEAPSQYECLKDLEWLVGEWIDDDGDSRIELVGKWDKNKNFILQHFDITVDDQFILEGQQIIGWDPAKEQIRSWMFDSDGGFGEGKWIKKADGWSVHSQQTLSDGREASSVNIYSKIGPKEYTWESTEREIDGELQPDIEPVVVMRKGEKL